jgi:transposase
MRAPALFVMDNAAIHKFGVVRELFDNSEHELCLIPVYSPLLNLVE